MVLICTIAKQLLESNASVALHYNSKSDGVKERMNNFQINQKYLKQILITLIALLIYLMIFYLGKILWMF